MVGLREVTEWLNGVHTKPKLITYRTLKSELSLEDYLSNIKDNVARREYTKLRGGTNRLKVEVGRWEKLPFEQRLCEVCASGAVEDEYHFMSSCWMYELPRRFMFITIREKSGYKLCLEHFREDRE